jgi:ABC-type uncharacterized transport system involved in gliding motility auxiliary subunit
MEDPTPFTHIGKNPGPLASYLESDWGITLDNDIVVDNASSAAIIAVGVSYNTSSPVTQKINVIAMMPQARSISISKTLPKNVSATGLIYTAPTSGTQHISWGKTDFSFLQNPNSSLSFDQSTDIPGPLTLAASGENATTHGRVVVFGSSLFAEDQYIGGYANSDVFVNSVDWAANQNNLINITPRTPITRTFNPPGPFALVAILLGIVFVIPGLVIGAGIFSWLERRRRG